MMYTLQDYDDEDLIVELKERGYAVYKNEEIEKSFVKLEGLQDLMKNKLHALKQMRGE